jgi:hypothetical protein
VGGQQQAARHPELRADNKFTLVVTHYCISTSSSHTASHWIGRSARVQFDNLNS